MCRAFLTSFLYAFLVGEPALTSFRSSGRVAAETQICKSPISTLGIFLGGSKLLGARREHGSQPCTPGFTERGGVLGHHTQRVKAGDS